MRIVALAGGVGGAKLVHGLAQVLAPNDLKVIVNTGDDFNHLGLRICPDIDTVCYTLAGLANPQTGWGRKNETWRVLTELKEFDGSDWFKLGDRDLALHLYRTGAFAEGKTLTQVVKSVCAIWQVETEVLPMCNEPVATMVETDDGALAFQEYFVKYQWKPKVNGFHFNGIESATVSTEVQAAINESDLIVIAPSNPWVSITPIVEVPGMKEILSSKPIIAVSPIIGGHAVKGPAAKMYEELGIEPSALAVAKHYQDLISGFVLDTNDMIHCSEIEDAGVHAFTTDIMMRDELDRKRLAKEVLEMGKKLTGELI